MLKPVLKRLWVGLRNAKTFRRCEEPLGIDTESIEIGQKFFRMLDEEHFLFYLSTASLLLASDIIQDNGYALETKLDILKRLRKGLCSTGLLS